MTIASFLGVLAGLITRFGLRRPRRWLGERDGDDDGQDDTALVVLAVVAVSAVVHGISFLLTRALSRYRELAAGRAAALRTGQPSVVTAALTKLSGDMAQIPTQDLRRAEPFNAFFFVPALAPGLSLSSMFSTHPSLTNGWTSWPSSRSSSAEGRKDDGFPGHPAGPQQGGAAQPGPAVRAARGCGHPPGGDRPSAHRYRVGVFQGG